MSGNTKKTVSPGEWVEHGSKPKATLFVEVDKGRIELYCSHTYGGSEVRLTPDQARSVAAKLIEMADHLDSLKK